MEKLKKYGKGFLAAVISAMVAILVHAFMPSPGAQTNPEMFDGILVQMLGFPIVASCYFLVLYLHILAIFSAFGEKSKVEKIRVGVYYGLAFGLMSVLLEMVHPTIQPIRKVLEVHVLCIGVNWIWFNCFMGLILKGMFAKMFLRSGVDVVFITAGAVLSDAIVRKLRRRI